MGRVPRGGVVPFFALTYAITWTLFIAAAAAEIDASSPAGAAVVLLGAWAPSMAALWLTARREGSAGVRALVEPVLRWRVEARWYLLAVGYIPAIKLTAALIHRLAAGAWPPFGREPLYLIPLAIAVSTPFQAGEEIGWRGYALPRLAARLGLARASVLLGVVWAAWHLPQFFIAQADTYRQSFVAYLLQVTALSVAMAWLYARTGGSLLLVMLMHAAVNNAKDIVPSAVPGGTGTFGVRASPIAWLTVTLLWGCAAWFLARMPAGVERAEEK
jgi:membrane protease YdiL (CAAX protease family)